MRLATSGAGWPPPPTRSWADGPNELAVQGNELVEVLERVPTRRLIVLGAPGAGKTTLMIRLVLDLLARRKAGDPVPVMVALASWDPVGQDLRTWLTARLTVDYPALAAAAPTTSGARTRAEALLTSGLILPILDGLDEIPGSLRSEALARINDSLRPGEAVVATSRTAEFKRAVRSPDGSRVTLRGAAGIELCPLDIDAAGAYLRASEAATADRARWDNFLDALDPQTPLARVLSNPQMLALANVIYNPRPGEHQGIPPDPTRLFDLADQTAIERYLVDAFIPSAYRDQWSRWSARNAQRWFVFMASQLQRLGTTDLAWWQVPAALRRQRPMLALVGGVIAGILLFAVWSALKLVHKLPAWPLPKIWGGLLTVAILSVAPALLMILALLVRKPSLPESLNAKIRVTYLDRVKRLLFPSRLSWPADVGAAPNPTTALRSARASAIFEALVSGLLTLLAFIVVSSLIGGAPLLVAAAVGAGYVGLLFAMTTAWGNFQLAHIWYASQGLLPYSLFAFLEDAQRRGLLRSAGAVYQFRNAQLQEVLADPARTPRFLRIIEELTKWASENPEIRNASENVGAERSDIEQAVNSVVTDTLRSGQDFEINAVSQQAVLERIRLRLNELSRRTLFSKSLHAQRAPGLGAVLDPAHVILTNTMTEVERVAVSVSSASVGISGVRGVGKSTLIRWICEGKDLPRRLPTLGLYVAAPVEYDARDFLIHLYARLCQAVLMDDRLTLQKAGWKDAAKRHVLGIIAVLLAALSTMTIFHLVFGHLLHEFWAARPGSLWAASVAAGFAASALFAGAYLWRLRNERSRSTVEAIARDRLRRLQYQITETTGQQAGTITGPFGLTLAGSWSRAATENQMTLPELVTDYRMFAEQVVSSLQQAAQNEGAVTADRVRLIVGIDEIDRIENAEKAEKFINEIKSIFGVPRCFYVASLSADALAQFERRAVTARTAFDTAFDTMIRMDPLDLKTTRQMLERRVIGLPYPFVALCHVLSGGVPRELMRVARSIFDVRNSANYAEQEEVDCESIADEVISRELQSIRQGLLPMAAQLAVPGTPEFVGLLDNREWPTGDFSLDILRISEILSRISHPAHADDRLVTGGSICDSFAAGAYFFLTVREVFRLRIDDVVKELREYDSAIIGETDANTALQDLVKARTVLALNPSLAVNRVRDFRKDYGLSDVTPPFLSQS